MTKEIKYDKGEWNQLHDLLDNKSITFIDGYKSRPECGVVLKIKQILNYEPENSVNLCYLAKTFSTPLFVEDAPPRISYYAPLTGQSLRPQKRASPTMYPRSKSSHDEYCHR